MDLYLPTRPLKNLVLWPLLITIFGFPNFEPHNLSYYGQKQINRHQDCENRLFFFSKDSGGHLGKWRLWVAMLDF